MKHLKTFESFNSLETNEAFWDSKEKKEANAAKAKEEAKKAIMNHPTRRKVYADLEKNHPDRAEKYLEFAVKNPGVMYCQWDENKKEFVSTGKFSVASGEGTSGK